MGSCCLQLCEPTRTQWICFITMVILMAFVKLSGSHKTKSKGMNLGKGFVRRVGMDKGGKRG